jgi:hypothetical protein
MDALDDDFAVMRQYRDLPCGVVGYAVYVTPDFPGVPGIPGYPPARHIDKHSAHESNTVSHTLEHPLLASLNYVK